MIWLTLVAGKKDDEEIGLVELRCNHVGIGLQEQAVIQLL
jgi:hypothetical protein